MGPLAGDGASPRPTAASNHAVWRPQKSAIDIEAPRELRRSNAYLALGIQSGTETETGTETGTGTISRIPE